MTTDDGTVPLTLADLKSLNGEDDGEDSADETLVEDSDSKSDSTPKNQAKTERIILRNSARHQALQINAALGEDIWKGIDRLVIKDNVVQDQAVQVNHGTTLEAALLLLDRQDERIAAARQRASRAQRHDNVVGP